MNRDPNKKDPMERREVHPDDVDDYIDDPQHPEPVNNTSTDNPDDIETDMAQREAEEGEGEAEAGPRRRPPREPPTSYPRIRQASRSTPDPTELPLDPANEPLDSDQPLLGEGEGTYGPL